jgi:hypothetical protein
MKTIRHFDSMTRGARNRDIVLTAETAQPVDLGQIWDGTFRPLLDRMPRATRDEIVRRIVSNYGNELGTSESLPGDIYGGLAFGGSPLGKPKPDLSTSATPDNLNDAAREFWGGMTAKNPGTVDRGRTVDTRRGAKTPGEINAANKAFWDRNSTPATIGGKWGRPR